jgi:hypothetical protein
VNGGLSIELPKLIATSVVRGSQQGESHGGVYLLDFDRQQAEQKIDWNSSSINFSGRGADRGLRGICFHNHEIYIAASDELFCYNRNFEMLGSWSNPYLKHCHEICIAGGRLFLTSTGFDSLLTFDLEKHIFNWGFHLQRQLHGWGGFNFDPQTDQGPSPRNEHHLNMVQVNKRGIFVSGLHTRALIQTDGKGLVREYCSLPVGTHNPQLFADGIVFNDTASDCVRYVPRGGEERVFAIPTYDTKDIGFMGTDDSKVARQAFGRGLCPVDDQLLAAGSSPSTVSLYDVHSGQTVSSINLSMDIRNAIHGLEVWPY